MTATVAVVLLLGGCAGRLQARHAQLSKAMQEVVYDGAHDPNCAPKASALAEASLAFAAAAIEDRKLVRARDHLHAAQRWIAAARAQTTADCAFRCTLPARSNVADPDDIDGDGYLDADDSCPEQPEDFDAIEDDDGCPESESEPQP